MPSILRQLFPISFNIALTPMPQHSICLVFILFFSTSSISRLQSQTVPKLILPSDTRGLIKFDISDLQKSVQKKFAYAELAVFVKNESGQYTSNPIQGEYWREGSYLIFKSYFPYESGMAYIVRMKGAHPSGDYSYQSFQITEKRTLSEAKVQAIYPSAIRLPENVLRFYLYFNSPMKKGQALTHIQLINAEGQLDTHAFMEFKQELWSPDGKRLTILFDPGRIKRGVSTNVERGPALREGESYRLRISGNWQDAYGQTLSINSTKEIEVIPAYRKRMQISEWSIHKPSKLSRDGLTIEFDRIMDHVLLQSMIKLVDTEGKLVKGRWELTKGEQSIQFIPTEKWTEGSYTIMIDPRLEDIAGNNLEDLLDHKTSDKTHQDHQYQSIEFEL